MPRRARAERPLFVIGREIWMKTRFGWVRIPRGYVTDFGSIPALASTVTLSNIRPLGRHAWATLPHDLGYAIGEAGKREMWDEIFRERMEIDEVPVARRAIMYRAVRLGGGGGYKKAPSWWATENFADPESGLYPVPPPFAREEAFVGAKWGLRPDPDWPA
jgi:hypothetical protein